jgi:hypothetical protein
MAILIFWFPPAYSNEWLLPGRHEPVPVFLEISPGGLSELLRFEIAKDGTLVNDKTTRV